MALPEALYEAAKKKEETVRTHVPLFRLIQGRGGIRHLISEIPNIFKSTGDFLSLSPFLFTRENGPGGKLEENEHSRRAVVSPASFKGVGVFPRPLKYE